MRSHASHTLKLTHSLLPLTPSNPVILPQSAFQLLVHLEISYPMMFKISNPVTEQFIHCGVIEFSAEEGMAYIPYWMMDYICLEPGSLCEIVNVTLPKGTYVEFQPHTYRFAELSNPRALLEHALRNYTTLTKGTTLSIAYLDEIYKIDVVNLKPADAVLIVETDLKVEFLPPKDNDEYEKKLAALRAANAASAMTAATSAASSSAAGARGSTTASASTTVGTSPSPSPAATGSSFFAARPTTTGSSTAPKRNPIFDKPGYSLITGTVSENKTETKTDSASAMSAASPSASSTSMSTAGSSGSQLPVGYTRQVTDKWIYIRDSQGRLIRRDPVSTAKFGK